ncbi:MAG: hypothetical protein ACXWUG_25260, partial [Polyangiales bacterium]
MNLLARLASTFAFLGVLLFAFNAGADQLRWATTGNYPKRSNTTKTIASIPFNKDTINTGINRDDCLDTAQEWQLFYDPASVVGVAYIDIYAQTGDGTTNCEDIASRPGGTAQTCYLIRRLTKAEFTSTVVVIHPYQIIAAVFGHQDASNTTLVNPTTAQTQCLADKSGNTPVAITLWSTPFTDSTTVVANGSLGLQTSYDISGPGAPTGLTLGAGNTIINAHFDSFSSTAYPDFKGMRAYCWPRSDFDGGTVSTTDTGTSADTAVTDSGTSSTDTAVDGAVDDATSTDTAVDDTSTTTDETSTPTGTCPANIPFKEGEYPPGGLVPCAERGQLSTEVTL